MQAIKTVLYLIVTIEVLCLSTIGHKCASELSVIQSEFLKMADLNTCVPQMDWSGDVAMSFRLFKQKCEIYFSIMNIAEDKQVDYILLLAGEEGLRKYNSWGLSEEKKKDPKEVWKCFQDQIEPKQSFRVERLYLRQFIQEEDETIDNFVSKCRLQCQKCEFRDRKEMDDRVIEQLIAGTKYPELQKNFVGKDKTLTLELQYNVVEMKRHQGYI